MSKVAVLGLGAMGAGMAQNLHANGCLHAAWNRSAARAEAFTNASGFRCAATLEEALTGVEFVLSCVSADADVLNLMEQAAPFLAPNSLWLDCSTVSSTTAKQAAEYLKQHAVGFVDAPVSGGKEGAEKGALSIMCGGSAENFARAIPVFDAIGSRWALMGAVGAGQATKAVNQIMAAGINQAVTEAMAFAERQGLPIDKVVDLVGAGAAGNWFVNHRGNSMVARDFRPGFRLSLHHKDLRICQSMAQAAGAPQGVIEQTLADYERLMQQGFGNDDISALYRLKAK